MTFMKIFKWGGGVASYKSLVTSALDRDTLSLGPVTEIGSV
jgi:hypothetical protein